MKNRYLYTFEVPKIEELEVVEKRMENGQEIKVTKKEKKIVERKYGILAPKRSKVEEGEMYYAAKVSENIKNGILPSSILIRKFDEQGGFLSDSEMKYQNSLRDDSIEISKKVEELSKDLKAKEAPTEAEKKEHEDKLNILIDRYYDIQEELVKIQQSIDSFFEQSAEIKARNKTIIWWILNLCYDLNDDKEEMFFKGKTLEDKLNSLDDLEESQEEFIAYLIKKFSYLTSYWFSSKISNAEQFKEAEKNFRLIVGVRDYDSKINEIRDRDAKATEEKAKLAEAATTALAETAKPVEVAKGTEAIKAADAVDVAEVAKPADQPM